MKNLSCENLAKAFCLSLAVTGVFVSESALANWSGAGVLSKNHSGYSPKASVLAGSIGSLILSPLLSLYTLSTKTDENFDLEYDAASTDEYSKLTDGIVALISVLAPGVIGAAILQHNEKIALDFSHQITASLAGSGLLLGGLCTLLCLLACCKKCLDNEEYSPPLISS